MLTKERLNQIVEQYNRELGEVMAKYPEKKGNIKNPIYIHLEFDYLTSNDLDFIFNEYKNTVKELLINNIDSKTFERKRVFNTIPLEIVWFGSENSLDIIMGIDPVLLIASNKHLIFETSINAIDWVGRWLILKEIIGILRQKLEGMTKRPNIRQLKIVDFYKGKDPR